MIIIDIKNYKKFSSIYIIEITQNIVYNKKNVIHNTILYTTERMLFNIKEIYNNCASQDKVINLYETVHKELGHTLLNKVEESKISLSRHKEVLTTLPFLSKSPNILVDVESFEQAIFSNTQKITSSLKECLSLAQITKDQIELIILTGGSTEIPYIKNSLLNMFPNAKISEEDKMSSVARGLSCDAKRIYG